MFTFNTKNNLNLNNNNFIVLRQKKKKKEERITLFDIHNVQAEK